MFTPVANCQNGHQLSTKFISDDIRALAEFDDELTNVRSFVIDHVSHLRMFDSGLTPL